MVDIHENNVPVLVFPALAIHNGCFWNWARDQLIENSFVDAYAGGLGRWNEFGRKRGQA